MIYIALVVALLMMLADAWSTVRNVSTGQYVEAGLVKYVLGTRPTARVMYLFSIGNWIVVAGFSWWALQYGPKIAIIVPTIGALAHGWAFYHNMKVGK
jgi:hypothetical protein